MKKILSITLAVAFIFAAMSISVFADEKCVGITCDVCNKIGCDDHVEHVVGNNGDSTITHKQGYTDGVDGFTSETGSHNITINFDKGNTNAGTSGGGDANSVIVHKYAVDIEYNDLMIDMTEILDVADGVKDEITNFKYVWDVTNHEYVVVKNANSTSDKNVAEIAGYKASHTMDAYKVINHSDLKIKFTDEAKTTSGKNYKLNLSSSVGTTAQTVDKAYVGTGASVSEGPDGSEWVVITATPTDENDWLDVVNAWGANNEQGACVIGTLTITITPYT